MYRNMSVQILNTSVPTFVIPATYHCYGIYIYEALRINMEKMYKLQKTARDPEGWNSTEHARKALGYRYTISDNALLSLYYRLRSNWTIAVMNASQTITW